MGQAADEQDITLEVLSDEWREFTWSFDAPRNVFVGARDNDKHGDERPIDVEIQVNEDSTQEDATPTVIADVNHRHGTFAHLFQTTLPYKPNKEGHLQQQISQAAYMTITEWQEVFDHVDTLWSAVPTRDFRGKKRRANL